MHRSYLFVLLILISSVLRSQTWDWGKSRILDGDDAAGDAGEHIGTDNEGNLYVTGWVTDYYNYNLRFLAKFDSNGNLIFKDTLWQFIVINSVTDTAGNTYVVGKNQRIGKFDKNGNQVWIQSLPNVMPIHMALMPGGGVVLWSINMQGKQPTYGNITLSGNYRFSFARCDENGNWLWAIEDENFAPNLFAKYNLVVTHDKKIYAAYHSYGNNPFAVKQFNENGVFEKGFVSCGLQTEGLAVDKSKNFYLLYKRSGSSSVVVNGVTYNSISTNNNALLLKFDSVGNVLWYKQIGDFVVVEKIIVDEKNNLYLSGAFCKDMVIDNVNFPSPNNYCNVFVCKMDSLGKVIWVKTSEALPNTPHVGGGNANLHDMVLDIHNKVIVTGTASNSVKFDNVLLHGGNNYPDFFLAKISQPELTDIAEHVFIDNYISVFPNPSTNEFSLRLVLKESDELALNIYDVTGRIIYEERLNKFIGTFDTKIQLNASQGVYFIEAIGKKSRMTTKAIIE